MIGQGMVTVVFWIVVALCCAYAFAFGGRDGRCASLMIVLAALASAWVQTSASQWASLNLSVMLIDVALLAGLMGLMFKSRAYWPIWMAGAQMMTVLTHVATTLVPYHAIGIAGQSPAAVSQNTYQTGYRGTG